MESWRRCGGRVWRAAADEAWRLWRAAADDDTRLLQGATTTPPPLMCVQDWPVEAACGVGYCGWQGNDLQTVAEVEEFFAGVCFEVDQRLGEPAACRWFLNWFDETPREEMRRQLLGEVSRTLGQRLAECVPAAEEQERSRTKPPPRRARPAAA
jgi:hypothetical protein